MKKKYEVPKAEKLEFDYSEGITASTAGCGGIYQKYTDQEYGCQLTPTGEWVHPFSDYAAEAAAKANH